MTVTMIMRAATTAEFAYEGEEVPVSHKGAAWSFYMNLQTVFTLCQGLVSFAPQ